MRTRRTIINKPTHQEWYRARATDTYGTRWSIRDIIFWRLRLIRPLPLLPKPPSPARPTYIRLRTRHPFIPRTIIPEPPFDPDSTLLRDNVNRSKNNEAICKRRAICHGMFLHGPSRTAVKFCYKIASNYAQLPNLKTD